MTDTKDTNFAEFELNGQTIFFGGGLAGNFEYDWSGRGGAIITDVPTPFFRFEDKKIQFSQAGERTKFDCAYFGILPAITNNWGVNWTQEDADWAWENKDEFGWDGERGMYMSRAGDMIIQRLNQKYPQMGWKKQSINLYEDGEYYMEKGYILHIGSIVNNGYFQEIQDGLISKAWGKSGPNRIGHVRAMFIPKAYDAHVEIENYYGVLPHNVIDIQSWADMVAANQFYAESYIYYPTKKMPTPITIPYNKGTTPGEMEIVRAWEEVIQGGWTSLYNNLTDAEYIDKMLMDIGLARLIKSPAHIALLKAALGLQAEYDAGTIR